MADDTSNSNQNTNDGINWAQLLASAFGLAGTGLDTAGKISLNDQGNQLYKLLLTLYTKHQKDLDDYNKRQETTDEKNQKQHDKYQDEIDQYNKDLRTNDQWNQEQYKKYASDVDWYNQNTRTADQTRQQNYDNYQSQVGDWYNRERQVDQTNQDVAQTNRTNAKAYQDARNAIAKELADPDQVKAGTEKFFNPYKTYAEDQTIEAQRRYDTARGIDTESGASRRNVSDAIAPLEAKFYQDAYQDYMTSKQNAVNDYTYTRQDYSPDYTKPMAAWNNPGYTDPKGAYDSPTAHQPVKNDYSPDWHKPAGENSSPGAPYTYQPSNNNTTQNATDFLSKLLSSLGGKDGDFSGLLKLLGLKTDSTTTQQPPGASGDGGPEVTTDTGTDTDTSVPVYTDPAVGGPTNY